MNGEKIEEKSPILGETPKKSGWKSVAKEIIIFVIVAFGIVLPFRMYVAEPYLVDGRSMDPTFATGQYLIVDKISYELGKPVARDSVLVFHYPNNPSQNFIKRVIGLPGETVVIKNGQVSIINADNPNGLVLNQSYIAYPANGDNMKVTLASDEYFVMGDNRAESFDSRFWGPLNKKYILGQPVLRLFPLDKIGILPGKEK